MSFYLLAFVLGMALTQKLDKLLVTKVLHNSVDQIKDHVEKKTEDREKIKLSKELKEGTKKLHREAERIRFVREFLRGKIERTVYMRQISDFYYLYRYALKCTISPSSFSVI